MPRPWMPFYIGDFLRDTQHLGPDQVGAYVLLIFHYWQHGGLPDDDEQLSKIVKMPRRKWRKNRAILEAFFAPGWRHNRIDIELEKSERAVMQRQVAGRNGGFKSGVSRARAYGEALRIAEATASFSLRSRLSENEATASLPLHSRLSENEPGGQAKTKQPRTNHNHINNILSSEQAAARAREGLDGGEDATVRPKLPSEVSRAEIDATITRLRQSTTTPTASPEDSSPSSSEDDPAVPEFLKRRT